MGSKKHTSISEKADSGSSGVASGISQLPVGLLLILISLIILGLLIIL